MVTIGGGQRSVTVDQRTQRAAVGLATTDVDVIIEAAAVGPVGPPGPPSTVYEQADPPAAAVLRPGDFWIKNPPVASPQPTYLWDGEEWHAIHGETVELDDLTGVSVVDPAAGDVIWFNGTDFVNEPGGVLYQARDADLTSIAALTSRQDVMLYATAAGTWALSDISAVARGLISATTLGAMRTYLNVWSRTEVGDPETNFVQIFNNGLSA